MNFNADRQILGIVAKSSVSYVKSVFDAFSQGTVVVNLRSESDSERCEMLGISEILVPEDDTGWVNDLEYPDTHGQPQDIAQVLFTSGTEGKPKAIMLSYGALANTTQRLCSIMEIDSTIREYIGVPVNYSFGFGRCRVVSQAGGKFYIPPNGFNPSEIAEMLQRDEINAISAVPTLWRVLLQSRELFHGVGKKVRWIEIGSQYMSRSEKEQLKLLFPEAKIVQHYGLTEASRSSFLKIHETAGAELESVGKVYDGVEISINDNGQIRIRGPHLATGQIMNAQEQSLVDEHGWFTTSDKGHVDGGYIYYEGRADDLINCGGVKLSPEVLEQGILAGLKIRQGIAISKIPDPLRGEQPLVSYLSDINADQLKTIAIEVMLKHGFNAGKSLKIMSCESFPFTDTGKIQRKKLAEQYQALESKDSSFHKTDSNPEDSLANKLISIWENVLKISPISVNDSFFDLGGDSLSAITVTMRMEKAGIPKDICRKIFEGLTIAQISEGLNNSGLKKDDTLQSTNTPSRKIPLAAGSRALNMVRGLLVLLNISAHWMPGVIERLPNIFSHINKYLAPLYSSGTPGFAIVFGAGIGFFFLPRYQKNPHSVTSVALRNALLLGGGIAIYALLNIAAGLANGLDVNGMFISNAFWSVLTYYFFAVLSIPLWLKALTRQQNFGLSCLAAATLFYSIHLLIDAQNIAPSSNPLIQPFVLLLTAKYNYFEMSTGVMLGAAAGNWIRETIIQKGSLKLFGISGVLLALWSIILSYELNQLSLWFIWPKGMFLWTWPFYLGVSILAITGVYRYATSLHTQGWFDILIKILVAVGGLAFPIFIAHELVMPIKNLLISIGIPGALPIVIILFFCSVGYMVHRMYRIQFGGNLEPA
ncbi:AMP-binding protein [Gynuella sp.]|uniref:AMP-binding protein n=1 Tax=Gynuella sp. TaxID=2969146 RepID=UPI003D145F76